MRLQETVPIRHVPEGVRDVRHAARGWLEAWRLPVDHDVVVLLLSELVSNAVEHGAPPATAHLRWEGLALKVSVRDALAGATPAPRLADGDAETGRGLALVEALADRWGVDHAATYKTVWFEIGPPTSDDDALAGHLLLWQDEVEPV